MKNIDQILQMAEHFVVLAKNSLETYQLTQEYLDSHPEELNKYLDKSLENTKRYQAKLKERDPIAFRAKQKEAERRYAAKQKARRAAGDIEGLLHALSKNIYSARLAAMNTERQASFELLAKSFQDLQYNIKNYLYGFNPSNPGHYATKEDLYRALDDTKRLITHLSVIGKSSAAQLQQILIKLQEIADNYIAQGPLN